MSIQNFVPPTSLLYLYIAFSTLRFENQRSIRAIASGRTGTNAIVPLNVNLTGFLGLLLMLVVLAIIFWFGGWQVALGLIVISTLTGILIGLVNGMLFGGDNFVVWAVATLSMWPVGYLLAQTIWTQYF